MFSLFFVHLTLIRIIKRGFRWIVTLPKYLLQPKIISRRICWTIGCLGPAEPCPSPVIESINNNY